MTMTISLDNTQLSDKAVETLKNWRDRFHQEIERPSWDTYFIQIAHQVKLRSLDAQTKCGCVIVTSDKTPLAFGYNSFIRNVDNSILPNIRPEKYPVMLHAEENALINCLRSGQSTINSIAYITGLPCKHCLQLMYQAGITEIVYDNSDTASKPHMCNNNDIQVFYDIFKYLVRNTNFKIRKYKQAETT